MIAPVIPSPSAQPFLRVLQPIAPRPRFGNQEKLPSYLQKMIQEAELSEDDLLQCRKDPHKRLQRVNLLLRSLIQDIQKVMRPDTKGVDLKLMLQNAVVALVDVFRSQDAISRDLLTGLRNEATFLSVLQENYDLTDRKEIPFTVAMGDIDYFKDINDNDTLGYKQLNGETVRGYGSHATGDVALKAVARAMQEALGDDGEAFRLHGEEFALLIPGKTLEESRPLLEKLSRAVYELRNHPDHFRRDEDHPLQEVFRHRPLALSLGAMEVGKEVVEYNITLLTISKLMDRALYAAKQNGRNRIYSIAPLSVEGPQEFFVGEKITYPPGTVRSTSA